VSFGEERPAAFGSTEEAYSQNRRVEIQYVN
jgi:outer membrane protein OmpA-like peptidoglycan-associated protein